MPNRTAEEAKVYYYAHREALLAYQSKWKKAYYLANRERLLARSKAYQRTDEVKALVQIANRVRYDCECGMTINDRYRPAHIKTKKHELWLAFQVARRASGLPRLAVGTRLEQSLGRSPESGPVSPTQQLEQQ